jgi:hypothetical protein
MGVPAGDIYGKKVHEYFSYQPQRKTVFVAITVRSYLHGRDERLKTIPLGIVFFKVYPSLRKR